MSTTAVPDGEVDAHSDGLGEHEYRSHLSSGLHRVTKDNNAATGRSLVLYHGLSEIRNNAPEIRAGVPSGRLLFRRDRFVQGVILRSVRADDLRAMGRL